MDRMPNRNQPRFAIVVLTSLAATLSGVCGGVSAQVASGPVWDECVDGEDDAGSTAPNAQRPEGKGELKCISGETGTGECGFVDGVDFEDMYVIRICDPADFMATTAPEACGMANFDTQLWLFKPFSMEPIMIGGLLANDDLPEAQSPASRLLPMADDGTNAFIDEPGVYFLAITGFDRDAISTGGPIFNQAERNEISGPDGPGGSIPHAGWESIDPPDVGLYRIAISGATFIDGIITIDCNDNGIHDACDIASGFSQDLNDDGIPDDCVPPCPADIANNDGVVDVSDLLLLLANWGSNGPGASLAAPFNIVDVQDLLELLAAWGPC